MRLVSPRPDDRAGHRVDRGPRSELVVPVRLGADGVARLMIVRQPDGSRVGLAFTTYVALSGVLGQGQPHLELAEQAWRRMLAEIGVARVVVDPAGLVTPSFSSAR